MVRGSERTVCSQVATSQAGRALEEPRIIVDQMDILRLRVASLGQVVGGGKAHNASSQNHGAHRECGAEG